MKEIIFATKNKGKVKELQNMLKKNNIEITLLSLNDLDENIEITENGKNFLENALIKAKTIFEKLRKPVIADDSGLIVESLGDKPGVYSARYAGKNATDSENNKKLLNDLKNKKNRKAYFECALIYINEKGDIFKAQEKCYGKIIDHPKGDNGFGYDPVFYLKEFDKTMAEIDLETKNRISHRGKAFRKLVKYLQED